VPLVSVHERGHATLGTHLTEIWKMIGSTFKVGGQVGPPVHVLASMASAVVALLSGRTAPGRRKPAAEPAVR
jgi:hypothetical protein